MGDGAALLKNACFEKELCLANEQARFGHASGVCFAAEHAQNMDAKTLSPQYLRLPRAQRELLKKQQQKEK